MRRLGRSGRKKAEIFEDSGPADDASPTSADPGSSAASVAEVDPALLDSAATGGNGEGDHAADLTTEFSTEFTPEYAASEGPAGDDPEALSFDEPPTG